MIIETTVYINDEIRKKLDAAAKLRGVTRSSLIVAIMRRVMREHGKRARFGRTVKYQEKHKDITRRCAHMSLAERDHECFIDMRKYFKLSVSLLVSYAVIRYLDETLNMIEENDDSYYTDNNMFNNYLFICNSTENSVCWTICWGIPEISPM